MRYVSVILADVPVHTMFIDILFVLHSLKQKRYKRVLNFVQQVFFLLSTEGSLVITRAYPALYLGGTPSQETGTSPPCCLLLENCLYMSPDSHMKLFPKHHMGFRGGLLQCFKTFVPQVNKDSNKEFKIDQRCDGLDGRAAAY